MHMPMWTILHTKGAEEEILGLLEAYEIRRAIVHWYSGPPDILDDMIARGCYFTVGVDLIHSDVARLIADDPWLSDVRGRFFE